MKYLLVLVAVWLAFWFWREDRRRAMRARQAPPAAAPVPALAPAQTMLRCAHCGLHVPANESIHGPDGQPYCSAAHRDAARA